MASERDYGKDVEAEVRRIGALLGIPDFVFMPAVVRKGSATREVGDGFLVAGDLGAIIQVKSRQPEAGSRDGARTDSVVRRMVDDATRQAIGTRREISRRAASGHATHVVPLRAVELPDSVQDKFLLGLPPEAAGWPAIVVVDHPRADDIEFPPMPDVFVITLQDWSALMGTFGSISAVLTYVRRILGADPGLETHLGDEEARFAIVVDADIESVDIEDPTWRPWVDGPVDETTAALFRDLVERVWEYDGEIPWNNADEYRTIVAALDSLPPSSRGELTTWILGKRRSLEETGLRSGGLAIVGDLLLVYFCDDIDKYEDREHFVAVLATVASARREEMIEQTGTAPRTLGIGVAVQSDRRGVAYNYAYFDGEIAKLPEESRRAVEIDLGRLDVAQRRLVKVEEDAPGGTAD